MSQELQTTKKPKPVKTDSLRVRKETKKKILSDLLSLNKKDFGRKLTADDYVQLAISLLTPDLLQKLKEKTLSNKDRLELKYQEYCSQNGKVTKDEFLGVLLSIGATV